MLDLLDKSPSWFKCPAEQSCYDMSSAGRCLAFAFKVPCMHRGYTLPAVWLTCNGNSDGVSLLRLRMAKISLDSGLSVLRLYASVTLRGEPHVGKAHMQRNVSSSCTFKHLCGVCLQLCICTKTYLDLSLAHFLQHAM